MLLIRPPLILRIAVGGMVVFGLCAVVAPVIVSATTDVDPVGTTFFAVFALVWTLFCARFLSLKVEVRSDGVLVVRNSVRTRVLRREDVEGFRLPPRGLSGLAMGNGILALLADATFLRLDATVGWPLPGRRRRLADMVEQLSAWAASPSR